VNIDGDAVVLDLLDSAGQEEFSAVRDEYMRDGQGFLMCYSVTSKTSFEVMHGLCEQLLRARDVDDMRNAKFAVMIVGNKSDMDDKYRQVSGEEGTMYADKHGYMFIEASAKLDINVGDAFFQVARGVRQALGADISVVNDMYTHKGIKAKHSCYLL
jgi:GTPase KRas